MCDFSRAASRQDRLWARLASRRTSLLGEGHGRPVDAVTQAARSRTIGEDVAEMGIAGGAANLRSPHEERAVRMLAHGGSGNRRREARPAGARIELGVGGKQGRAAAVAAVDAAALLVPERPGEGAFGAVLPGHVVLRGCQLGAPFALGLDDADRDFGGTHFGGGIHGICLAVEPRENLAIPPGPAQITIPARHFISF
jgi:hypothetical protein